MELNIKNPLQFGGNEFCLNTDQKRILLIKNTTIKSESNSKIKKVEISLKSKLDINDQLSFFRGSLQGLINNERKLNTISSLSGGDDKDGQSVKITAVDPELPDGENRVFDVYLGKDDLVNIINILTVFYHEPVKIG